MRMSYRIIGAAVGCLLIQGMLNAQDAPTLTLNTEHNLGPVCLIASVRQPDTQTVWVLTDEDCDEVPDLLRSYDLSSAEVLSEVAVEQDYFDNERYEIYSRKQSLFVLPDGLLQLNMEDQETYTFQILVIDPVSGMVTPDEDTAEALNSLLSPISEYFTYTTTFSPDRTIATIGDETVLHIIDVTTGEDLFQTDDPFAAVAFSSDSKLLYISALNDPFAENLDFSAGTLNVYSVPDGEIVKSLEMPAAELYPAPDNQTVAAIFVVNQVGDEPLGVFKLDTGLVSNTLLAGDTSKRVTKCTNTGKDISDVDFKTPGILRLVGFYWRPDNTGFVTFNSQIGSMTNTGCTFDFSRQRDYSVSGG